MVKWSFSSLKQYKTCPKQYYELRVAKNYTSKDGEASIYGKEVHKALEEYVKNNKPLPKNYEQFKIMVDPLLDIAGTKYCEKEMALTTDLKPCGFNTGEYWVRGIADLLIVDGDVAFIVDYKTGKTNYADTSQLKLMAAMTFAHHPEVQKIKSALMFVSHNVFICEEYLRNEIESLWALFKADLRRLDMAFENALWPANPNGLCKNYCPVDSCKYHGGR